MQDNYTLIAELLRNYCTEFLGANEEPARMLETLQQNNPQIIPDAQKPNLLAAAIVYIYLKRNNLNGRGGITTKNLGKYFDVKGSTITQKVFDVEFYLGFKKGSRNTQIYEFVDKDRFEVNELYWDFLDSKDANDAKKSIKILTNIIKKDPDYFDPYISLYEYYLENREFKKAISILQEGYARARALIDNNGRFPDELPWGFIENRHIIRMLFNYAMFLWEMGNTKEAQKIFMDILKSNPNDNIGARYSIVAILEGFASQAEYEERFANSQDMIEYKAHENWFLEAANKHRDVIGWWLDLADERK